MGHVLAIKTDAKAEFYSETISFSRGSSPTGSKPKSYIWQADSLPLSHLGSPYTHIDAESFTVQLKLPQHCQ